MSEHTKLSEALATGLTKQLVVDGVQIYGCGGGGAYSGGNGGAWGGGGGYPSGVGGPGLIVITYWP